MTYQDHSVGTRRDPSPTPAGFIPASYYTDFTLWERSANRLRAITPDQRAAMELSMPGVEPAPYPLVAPSPFAIQSSAGKPKYSAGRASIGNNPEQTLDISEEVNAVSEETQVRPIVQNHTEEHDPVQRSLGDTWLSYAMSPGVTGEEREVERTRVTPPFSPSNSFYDVDHRDTRSKENVVHREVVSYIIAALSVIVGLVLIALD